MRKGLIRLPFLYQKVCAPVPVVGGVRHPDKVTGVNVRASIELAGLTTSQA